MGQKGPPPPSSFSESLFFPLSAPDPGRAQGLPDPVCLVCLLRASPAPSLSGSRASTTVCAPGAWGGAGRRRRSESQRPASTAVPPSPGLLHGEQRVRLRDGRPDHGGGHRRGHQPPAAQPLPLPLSPASRGQLHALVRARDPRGVLRPPENHSPGPQAQPSEASTPRSHGGRGAAPGTEPARSPTAQGRRAAPPPPPLQPRRSHASSKPRP